MIASGITTVMHQHVLWRLPAGADARKEAGEVIRAYRDAGMRVAFAFVARDKNQVVYQDDQTFLATLPKELAARLATRLRNAAVVSEDYLSLFVDLFESHGRNGPRESVRHVLSPANVQWCSDTLLANVKDCALRYRTGVHIHVQETAYQKMYGLKYYGKTPLAHLDDLGFLGPEVTCAHGVWFTESDIDILARTGTSVCHNASSNLRHKSGVAPINRMLANGITVAIGLDGSGLNDDNDIFQEMRLVRNLHRAPGVDQPSPTSHQVLWMATIGGARTTLFANQIGALEEGKKADIVLLDLNRIAEPFLAPEINVVDAVLYRGMGQDVDTVIVDGEVVMKDRQFTRLRKEEVWAALKTQLDRPFRPDELEREEIARQLHPYIVRFYEQWSLNSASPYYAYNDSI